MEKITRRDFLVFARRALTVTGLGVILAPIISYFYPAKLEEIPSDPVLVSTADGLPAGESKTVRFGRYPALVIHTPNGLRAYSAVCTHFACIVKWDPAVGKITCPCHDAMFDPEDGGVLAGPPPSPLLALGVNVVDGNIYVGGEQ